MATGTSSPCGACKFLRRKCASDCIFAPYFCSGQGQARFAAIHKIFGASNVSKLLFNVPQHDRCEAVVTIAYEAQARIRDPVYGCVSHIFALQQQVASLQAQLMQVKAQLAHNLVDSRSVENRWPVNTVVPPPPYLHAHSMSPPSSLDSIDHSEHGLLMQGMACRGDLPVQSCTKKRFSQNELGELQALALRMMRN
ncbi:lateral organ boundaries-domain 16 [Tasmannia lanceolata]|uniref:lateral organ boundaries-domain 16 n=1 Tax=Tasmannia lanceolata TaxID=3420 RepID=UPI004064570C